MPNLKINRQKFRNCEFFYKPKYKSENNRIFILLLFYYYNNFTKILSLFFRIGKIQIF